MEADSTPDLTRMCNALNISMDENLEKLTAERNTENMTKLIGHLSRRSVLQMTSDDEFTQFKRKKREARGRYHKP